MLKTSADAVELCAKQGRSVALYSVPWVKPLDEELLRQLAKRVRLIVTVEEAKTSGGLGGAVAEVLAGEASSAQHMRLGFEEPQVSNILLHFVHSQEGARVKFGLDHTGIARRIMEFFL
jgi:transketolase C-terminal domain/subunit